MPDDSRYPGGFLVAGGNVHIIDYRVMTVANGIIYTGVAYGLLVSLGKHNRGRHTETG